jgi:succinate-acetate transporter protein
MNAATTGDVYNFTITDGTSKLPINLTGLTVTCEVIQPINIGTSAYAWPGLLSVTNATGGVVQLITKPTCFPVGSQAPYYLQFALNNNAGTISKSRLFPIQIGVSIL